MGDSGSLAATPRQASTVILVREAVDRLQVYLLKRSARSEFMPGTFVFPGGMVEPADDDPDFWSHRLDAGIETLLRGPGEGMDRRGCLAHAVAAIRETLEEAGVFLGPADEDPPNCERPGQGSRSALPGAWFKEWVLAENRILGVSRLRPWGHWITPIVRQKRYDTRFFLAFLPRQARCAPDAEETTEGVWISPREALWENEKGTVPLSPPTLVTLSELLAYKERRSLERDLQTRHWGAARLPRLQNLSEGVSLLLPWDPDYGPDALEARETAGVPFSRLCFDGKLWHAPARARIKA